MTLRRDTKAWATLLVPTRLESGKKQPLEQGDDFFHSEEAPFVDSPEASCLSHSTGLYMPPHLYVIILHKLYPSWCIHYFSLCFTQHSAWPTDIIRCLLNEAAIGQPVDGFCWSVGRKGVSGRTVDQEDKSQRVGNIYHFLTSEPPIVSLEEFPVSSPGFTIFESRKEADPTCH